MDRNKVEASVFAVDVRNELADLSLEFWGVGQGGRCHLNHDNVAYPLGEILKELLKCAQLRSGKKFRLSILD